MKIHWKNPAEQLTQKFGTLLLHVALNYVFLCFRFKRRFHYPQNIVPRSQILNAHPSFPQCAKLSLWAEPLPVAKNGTQGGHGSVSLIKWLRLVTWSCPTMCPAPCPNFCMQVMNFSMATFWWYWYFWAFPLERDEMCKLVSNTETSSKIVLEVFKKYFWQAHTCLILGLLVPLFRISRVVFSWL